MSTGPGCPVRGGYGTGMLGLWDGGGAQHGGQAAAMWLHLTVGHRDIAMVPPAPWLGTVWQVLPLLPHLLSCQWINCVQRALGCM